VQILVRKLWKQFLSHGPNNEYDIRSVDFIGTPPVIAESVYLSLAAGVDGTEWRAEISLNLGGNTD
jgi:hypothetical protein